jgi:protein-arginine kinase activator protein McsA
LKEITPMDTTERSKLYSAINDIEYQTSEIRDLVNKDSVKNNECPECGCKLARIEYEKIGCTECKTLLADHLSDLWHSVFDKKG